MWHSVERLGPLIINTGMSRWGAIGQTTDPLDIAMLVDWASTLVLGEQRYLKDST